MAKQKYREETLLNHDDTRFDHNPVIAPLYQNSLFTFDSWEEIDEAFDNKAQSYIYSRLMNPTVQMAEEKIARLCHAQKAKLCASGIAAISSAVLHCVNAGDHIISVRNIYGPSYNFIVNYLGKKFNIDCDFIDGSDPGEIKDHIHSRTRLIYLESPTSLNYRIQDIRGITQMARENGIKTIIDNTWATPVFQKPLDLGVDLEVHSVSKYLCGHSDVVAGVIAGRKEDIDGIILAEHEWLGAKMAPFEAWLILRSLRTLHIRMEKHQSNAMAVAQFLEAHPAIKRVLFPGLKSFPQYKLARSQMTGCSGLLSFELRTTEITEVKAFISKLSLFKLGVSWGGHESLVYAPAISYMKELGEKILTGMGISPGLIRISVGLENPKDLIDDLGSALEDLNVHLDP